jgi:hypothetical protein
MQEQTMLWLPLMGTGAGGLALGQSLTIIVSILKRTGWADRPAQITISLPSDFDANKDPSFMAAIRKAKTALAPSAVKVAAAAKKGPVVPALTPGVAGLLSMAAALRKKRKGTGGRLSTTLLLFALAEAGSPYAPQALRADSAAALFAATFNDLAAERYGELWANYFAGDRDLRMLAEPDMLPQMTSNLTEVLKISRMRAEEHGRDLVSVDDLVEALFSFEEGNFNRNLLAVGLAPDQLLIDYRDARTGEIMMSLHNDVASVDDKLGYATYADAITLFLLDAATPPPLSISIQAPWGAGKSSLMQMIRERLDPSEERNRYRPEAGGALSPPLRIGHVLDLLNHGGRTVMRRLFARKTELADQSTASPAAGNTDSARRPTIWFNAWKYETSEQVWAGLVDAIVSQVSERLPLVEREKFLLKLQLARIDDNIIRQKIYDRLLTIWWGKVRRWLLVGVPFVVSVLASGMLVPGGSARALGLSVPFPTLAFGGALTAQILLCAYLAGAYARVSAKVKSEPAAYSLADYVRVPDYSTLTGQIHHINNDLRQVLSVTPDPTGAAGYSPLVIFIDDLDRCSPGKVASVVEGVSMLLASDTYRCVFVIGMDPQMIAAALEKAHEDVRQRLPSYERTVPVGWRFMDKFIQLPFTIPPSRKDRMDEYLVSLGAAPPQSELPKEETQKEEGRETAETLPEDGAVSAPAPAGPLEARRDPADAPLPLPEAPREARDVGKIIRLVAGQSVGNPREVKRMVNLARLYLKLRNTRRQRDPKWISPDLGQYARWIVLTLRWPDMMRWLQWGADEATWQSEDASQELIVRRLRILQSAAASADSAKDWQEKISTELRLGDDIDWAGDPMLFEFFRNHTPPEKSLAAAAALSFW